MPNVPMVHSLRNIKNSFKHKLVSEVSLWLFVNNRVSHSVFKLSQDSQTKHAEKTPSKGRDWTRVICSSEFNLVESLERFYSRIIPWWDKSRTREKQAERAVTCGQDEVSRDHILARCLWQIKDSVDQVEIMWQRSVNTIFYITTRK